MFSNLTCGCECNQELHKNCDLSKTSWNPKICQCECKNPKIQCLNETVVDPETDCTRCMHVQVEGCPGNQKWFKKEGKCRCDSTLNCSIIGDEGAHVWDDINCKCKCNITGDQIACSVHEYFDYPSCSCVCNVLENECPHSLEWNPLTCKCEFGSLLPSFAKIMERVNKTLTLFPELKKNLHKKDEF